MHDLRTWIDTKAKCYSDVSMIGSIGIHKRHQELEMSLWRSCQLLVNVRLSECSATTFKWLSYCPLLETIQLTDCSIRSFYFIDGCLALKSIGFLRCYGLGTLIAADNMGIRNITFDACKNLEDIDSFLQSCPDLK